MILLVVIALQASDAVARLAADDIDVRERAAAELRSIGAAAIPELEKVANTDSPDLRERARALLRELDATTALIAALRDDDIPGNAKRARQRLLERYDDAVRDALTSALDSDDTQQAVQAAYLLLEKNALKAPRGLARRAAAALFHGRTPGYESIATQLVLSLADDDELRLALKGVKPSSLHRLVRTMRQQADAMKVPFPAPLLRHYLRNLRHDDCDSNGTKAQAFARDLGRDAVPLLREWLADRSAQARRLAGEVLLDLGERDLPPAALAALVDHDDRALPLLLAQGDDAQPALRALLESTDCDPALVAGRALLRIDHAANAAAVSASALRIARQDASRRQRLEALSLIASTGVAQDLDPLLEDEDVHIALGAAQTQLRMSRPCPGAVQLAIENLPADDVDFNARMATELLVLADAVPDLKRLLGDDDDQVVVAAAVALHRLGKLAVTPALVDRLQRAVASRLEEDGATAELVGIDELGEVAARLRASDPARFQTLREGGWLQGGVRR